MSPKLLISTLFLIISSCFLNIKANPGTFDRIVGGVNTLINSIPYQVALHPMPCGGSILSSKWIITAAHCLIDKTESDVQFGVGVQDRRNINYLYNVVKLIQHPHFDKYSFNNDIALLKSAEEIIFNASVQPIKLGKITPHDNTLVQVSGYGTTADGTESYTLLSVYLNIFNYENCNIIHDFALTDNMICAYGENVDSCQGDSGGPLTYNGELVGIVSWGIDCALKDNPGVYTKVTNYISWINENTKNL